jgi:DNA-binding MarR family transcriptional regulator
LPRNIHFVVTAVKEIILPVLPIDSPERRRLPPLLRRAWYGLNQAFRRRIAHLEITPDQFTVLRTLLEHDGVTQRELTHLISSDPNTVASLLERMETAGLIERKTHEKDRRANRLKVRPAGKKKYSEAREIAIALQAQILSILPEAKREEFLQHLGLVADACRDAVNFTPPKQ